MICRFKILFIIYIPPSNFSRNLHKMFTYKKKTLERETTNRENRYIVLVDKRNSLLYHPNKG